MDYLDKVIEWVHQKTIEANAKGVIVGISGGIDSALVAYIAKKAFPNNSLGILLPINRQRLFDLEDGMKVVKKLSLDHQIIDIFDEYNSLVKKMNIDNSNLVKGNLQARLRMSILYALAQEKNYLVLGTDNRAEYMLGYFTKWGDGGCDLLPIVHLYKSEVFELAKKIGIPKEVINKSPSAGLWEEQTDEKELGFSYNDFENYDKGLLKNKELIDKIELQILRTEHKRKAIPQPPERNK